MDKGYGLPSPPPEKKIEKEKPNFGLSGKLTEETNTYKGIVIKYSEPPEARKPQKIRWRLYPFKGEETLPVMYIHRQSAFLLGRERKIADIPIDHPSCSKQHAAIQFRLMPYERPDGSKGRRIRPYIIDLESANGTFVNGNKISPSRYVELFEKDVLKFGFSSREYVILHEESKNIQDEEDEPEPTAESPSPPPLKRIKAERTDEKKKVKKEKDRRSLSSDRKIKQEDKSSRDERHGHIKKEEDTKWSRHDREEYTKPRRTREEEDDTKWRSRDERNVRREYDNRSSNSDRRDRGRDRYDDRGKWDDDRDSRRRRDRD